MRLIDLDVAIKDARANYGDVHDAVIMEHFLNAQPTVDAATVVHGRWIYDGGNEYVDHYHCDRCGQEIDLCNEIYTEPKPNYCKNCGAKMDLPDDGE